MADSDTRNVNPDDLDQLGKTLDGKGGVGDRADEAFTRAARLGVTSQLANLKPMRSWVTSTAPDLRTRAATVRLENGDPQAGARWAGFGAEDLAKAALALKAPDVLLLAKALATSGDSKADAYRRESNESLDDWVDRLRAHVVASSIPGLKPYEGDIAEILGLTGDVKGFLSHGGSATFHGANLTRVLVMNSLTRGFLQSKKLKAAALLRWLPMKYDWVPGWVGVAGNKLQALEPVIKSLSAPGTWLPSKLGALASGSSIFQRLSGLPVAGRRIDLQLGAIQDALLRSGTMTNPVIGRFGATDIIKFFVGNDDIAKSYQVLTHSGQLASRASNASLWKVTKASTKAFRLAGDGRFAALGKGLNMAGKAGGLLRGVGVAGGVYSTLYSGANVWAQGNPAKHFGSREDGARYVADVAEVGFNASLTAATVAPNPFTIGAVAVTGAVWAGAKVVEHWDDITGGAAKATHWAGDKASELGSGIAHGAKSVAKKLNPASWF